MHMFLPPPTKNNMVFLDLRAFPSSIWATIDHSEESRIITWDTKTNPTSKQHLKYVYAFFFICLSVQSFSHVWLFVTPWTAARPASLSFTISRSLLKLMTIKSVMTSSHLILCHLLLHLPPIPPSIRVFSFFNFYFYFPMSQLFAWGGQSIGVSTSASFLSMNIHDWLPLGLTGLISLQSKRPSRVLVLSRKPRDYKRLLGSLERSLDFLIVHYSCIFVPFSCHFPACCRVH